MPDPGPWRFFPESYDTERLKSLSVWLAFRDEDLRFRCAARARAAHTIAANSPCFYDCSDGLLDLRSVIRTFTTWLDC